MNKEPIKVAKVYLVVVVIFITTSLAVCAGGNNKYWLAIDGDTDPDSVSTEYIDTWSGLGLEQRIVQFQWYTGISGTEERVPIADYGRAMGGTKALLSMGGSENDWYLIIQIYRGGLNKPSASSEILKWTIVNGKNSYRDSINVVFTDPVTGRTSKAITLYDTDVVSIGIPHCAEFNCRMWIT